MIVSLMLKQRLSAGALMTVLLLSATQVSAIGLLQAYESALQNDATYRSAVHDNDAGKEYAVLGRSNLLPSLSASYSASKNRTDITAPNFLGKKATTHPEYRSSSGGVSLRQPLFNLDALARYRQGLVQTSYSEALFAARLQDLVVRLVGAYIDAKYEEDQLALAMAQRDTFGEQKRVNARMFEKGEGTKTDMLETQAKFDLAEAQLIESQDNLATARNMLASIVGSDITSLDSLTDDFHVKPMEPAAFDDWKVIALENNTELRTQRYTVEASRLEVHKNLAGHAPRVDLFANYSKNDSESINTYNQESTVRSIGFQLSIPLYSGGSVSAASRQAEANYEKAKSELEGKTKQVLVEVRKQYNLTQSGVAKIDALVKSVNSATQLVEATRQSMKGGVRINLDLLNAQQQLFSARRDLALARYSYLLSYLRLRNASGILGADDLQIVAGYFVTSQ